MVDTDSIGVSVAVNIGISQELILYIKVCSHLDKGEKQRIIILHDVLQKVWEKHFFTFFETLCTKFAKKCEKNSIFWVFCTKDIPTLQWILRTFYLWQFFDFRPSYLEFLKEVVQLLGTEVPGQFSEQIVHVFDNGLMFALLGKPDVIQVTEGEHLFLYHKPDDLLQLLHILGLVEGVSEHDLQHSVLLDPFLKRIKLQLI